jgi:hypothetical protein
MKRHTKLYMTSLGYGIEDFIPSELTASKAVDIHHIRCRGLGSSKKKDTLCNLMALTREEHLMYGDKTKYMDFLISKHFDFLRMRQTDGVLDRIIKDAISGCELSKRYLHETTN